MTWMSSQEMVTHTQLFAQAWPVARIHCMVTKRPLICIKSRNIKAGWALGGGLSANTVTPQTPEEDNVSIIDPEAGALEQ